MGASVTTSSSSILRPRCWRSGSMSMVMALPLGLTLPYPTRRHDSPSTSRRFADLAADRKRDRSLLPLLRLCFGDVAPRHGQRATHRPLIGSGEADVRGAAQAPCAFDGRE